MFSFNKVEIGSTSNETLRAGDNPRIYIEKPEEELIEIIRVTAYSSELLSSLELKSDLYVISDDHSVQWVHREKKRVEKIVLFSNSFYPDIKSAEEFYQQIPLEIGQSRNLSTEEIFKVKRLLGFDAKPKKKAIKLTYHDGEAEQTVKVDTILDKASETLLLEKKLAAAELEQTKRLSTKSAKPFLKYVDTQKKNKKKPLKLPSLFRHKKLDYAKSVHKDMTARLEFFAGEEKSALQLQISDLKSKIDELANQYTLRSEQQLKRLGRKRNQVKILLQSLQAEIDRCKLEIVEQTEKLNKAALEAKVPQLDKGKSSAHRATPVKSSVVPSKSADDLQGFLQVRSIIRKPLVVSNSQTNLSMSSHSSTSSGISMHTYSEIETPRTPQTGRMNLSAWNLFPPQTTSREDSSPSPTTGSDDRLDFHSNPSQDQESEETQSLTNSSITSTLSPSSGATTIVIPAEAGISPARIRKSLDG